MSACHPEGRSEAESARSALTRAGVKAYPGVGLKRAVSRPGRAAGGGSAGRRGRILAGRPASWLLGARSGLGPSGQGVFHKKAVNPRVFRRVNRIAVVGTTIG